MDPSKAEEESRKEGREIRSTKRIQCATASSEDGVGQKSRKASGLQKLRMTPRQQPARPQGLQSWDSTTDLKPQKAWKFPGKSPGWPTPT